MKKGLLIILSGPSGVGKGTVRHFIMSKFKKINLAYSISMTTRPIRKNEKDGKDYYFVTNEQFDENIKNNNFLEWAEFVGNRYGTPKDKVEALRNEGKNVLLEIEINGAESVMKQCKDDEGLVSFFLMPPSFDALESRIRKRKSETEDVIQQRLEKGRNEMKKTGSYNYIIYNNTVPQASRQIVDILKGKLK